MIASQRRVKFGTAELLLTFSILVLVIVVAVPVQIGRASCRESV